MRLKIDNFLVAIVLTVLFARYFSHWGGEKSPLPLGIISSIGVSLIFLFYGLKLSPEKIKTGLTNWKLHVLVQLSTFLLFPIVVLCFYPFALQGGHKNLWIAFLFLAALPSTVSSSVVMVSIARGNLPAAIFNASISGLIGIVITPLWMGFFMQQPSDDYDLQNVYLKLVTEILLPVIAGLLLQKYLGRWAISNGRWLTLFDKSVILLIIFKSFAESFERNLFQSVGLLYFIVVLSGVVGLFCFVYFVIGYLAKKLAFNREDTITAQFCGTKKSLVHGTVFSKIIFDAAMPLGVVLLPLMVFHALQIFIVSIVASRLQKQVENR